MAWLWKQLWRFPEQKVEKTMVKTMVKQGNSVDTSRDSRHLHQFFRIKNLLPCGRRFFVLYREREWFVGKILLSARLFK
jgi:hypothetical protein